MDDLESDNLRLVQRSTQQDTDLSDETQDFRFLEIFNTKKADQQSLPKRGEKDFEPDGTDLQSRILHDSRKAMHDALCGERKHNSKQHVEAIWRPQRKLAEVRLVRGTHFKHTGKTDSTGVTWLLPEETIYLVERGSLECWWEEGIPMSLQGVYASCLEHCGGLERYQVYSYLKRLGYIVYRAPNFHREDYIKPEATSQTMGSSTVGLFEQVFHSIFGLQRPSTTGPLVPPAVYRSHEGIYRRLSIIPRHHHHNQHTIATSKTELPFCVVYHLWKPRQSFKKSDPGEPDFRLAVVSTTDTSLPTLSQINALFGSLPFDESFASKNQFQRLKDGQKNVILAIIDSGVISFLKFADVGFGEELMFLRKQTSGRKSKGGGGGNAAAEKGKRNPSSSNAGASYSSRPQEIQSNSDQPGILPP